jgi:hypothetical protein
LFPDALRNQARGDGRGGGRAWFWGGVNFLMTKLFLLTGNENNKIK